MKTFLFILLCVLGTSVHSAGTTTSSKKDPNAPEMEAREWPFMRQLGAAKWDCERRYPAFRGALDKFWDELKKQNSSLADQKLAWMKEDGELQLKSLWKDQITMEACKPLVNLDYATVFQTAKKYYVNEAQSEDLLNHAKFNSVDKHPDISPCLGFTYDSDGDRHNPGINMLLDRPLRYRVIAVQAESPAAEVGLQSGDYYVGLDGKSFFNIHDTQLPIWSQEPGAKTTIAIERGSQRMTIPMTIGGRAWSSKECRKN